MSTVSASDIDISDSEIEGFAADSYMAVPSDTVTWQNVVVRNGDNLSAIFKQLGLSDQDMFRVLNSGEEAGVLNRLFPGYQLDFMMPTAGELAQLRVLKSPLEGFMFTRDDQGYAVEPIVKVADLGEAFRVGTVSDSLFMAGQKENIPAEHIMEMANILAVSSTSYLIRDRETSSASSTKSNTLMVDTSDTAISSRPNI